MAAPMTEGQRLEILCTNSRQYPDTLLRKPRPHEVHVRKKHAEYLEENDKILFNEEPDEHLIQIMEINAQKRKKNLLLPGPQPLTLIVALNLKAIPFRTSHRQLQHMQLQSNEWDIRHVFFEASDSRSPLNCSSDMLKSCFTFHQVEPSFLDSLYTFGDQDKPTDLCLAHFKSSHTIEIDEEDLIAIPELRRSGREMRMSYLLRSMEYDKESSNKWKWNLRQTAVYHSFDAETGQSFWCNIKANDEFNKRIKDSASALNLGQTGLEQDHRVHRLFTATLSTHLIYLSWCDENWRWCINDMEIEISTILEKALLAPIDDRKSTVPEYVIKRAVTMETIRSRGARENSAANYSASVRQSLRVPANMGNLWKTLSHFFSQQRKSGHDLEMAPVSGSAGPKALPVQHFLVTLDQFRVGELQALHVMGERIERSILAVQLNITVLDDISAYYSGLTESLVKLHSKMRKQYELEIKHFKEEITNIIRGLETRKTQLRSLAAQLSEGQKLYDGLLQYRNIQIGQTFSESAETSARKMETIAYKTAQETASMHIITIVTLIFLPGTFVATFFQSGVFWWKDAPDDMESTWRYRGDAFAFFSKLCFPLMMATLGAWLCVSYKMKRDRHKEEQKHLAVG